MKDNLGIEKLSVSGPVVYDQVLGMMARPGEHGIGDCDDATVLSSAMCNGIGVITRIATIAGPFSPPQELFGHVFTQAYIPRIGWTTVDPVGHPEHEMGWTPPYSRFAAWDLDGRLLEAKGNFPPSFKSMLHGFEPIEMGVNEMYGQLREPEDIGLEKYGEATLAGYDGDEPEHWDNIVAGFGGYSDDMGYIDGPSLRAEYDEGDVIGMDGLGNPVIRTKMFEMNPSDYQYLTQNGYPRYGTLALGDDGDLYQWQPGSMGDLGRGFFRRLKKRIKKGFRKVAKAVGRVKRKMGNFIKKMPGGKYLVKFARKAKRIAMKAMPILSRVLPVLAPIAAAVPGIGPAISGALAIAGKAAGAISKVKRVIKIAKTAKGLVSGPEYEYGPYSGYGSEPYRVPEGIVLPAGSIAHTRMLQGLGVVTNDYDVMGY